MQACKSLSQLLVRTLVAPSMILACALATSQADVYPGNSIIHVVVPTPPGPPPDVIARIIATELSESEGWRVVVDNRPGALQVTAMTDVLKRPADGLSIFPMSLGAIPTPALAPDKGIRLQNDFDPVIKIATGYSVLVVPPSLPVATLRDLVALLKAQPGKLNYSSGGFGTPAHLLGEMFKLQTGTSFASILYPQNAQRLSDLMTAQTQFAFFNSPAVVDLVAAGKLRALAVTGSKRIAALADVQTVTEAGFPNLVAEDWVGFVVKAGTSADHIARLNAAANKALSKQKIQHAFELLGYEPAGGTSDALGSLISSQVGYWTKVVTDSGIRMP
jgi:tripartite-type tricarboxylate transporter receptor subunit TctC